MKIFALILAGGQESRMGGVDKGLVQWHNKALVDHVIEKTHSQVSRIATNANRNLESYAQRSAHVFSDARQWQHYDPLAASYTAANDLQIATADWLLIVSCDTPCLPENLISQFGTIAKRTPLCNAFYVETPSRPHYSAMFIRPQIPQSTVPYLYSGTRSIRGWLQQQCARVVPFLHEQDFISYNTENDLAQPLQLGRQGD